jgi:hypothetical protein
MTTNQKILITFGLSALAFYVYTRLGKKTQGNVGGTNNSPQSNNTMGSLVNGTRSATEIISGSAGVGNTNMPNKSQEQIDCERQYLMSPKPAVVRTREQEARMMDAAVKRCMESKKRSMLQK